MAKKVTKKAAQTTKATKTRKPRQTAGASAKAKGKASEKATAKVSVDTNGALSQERIRERAYEIYRAGRNPSDPTADWYQAERELRTELGH